MAIGVIRGVRRAGVRVPEDVSVIGFDNVALAEIVDPELTAVAAPLRTMGIIGITHLITMIGGATPSRDPIVLPVKLIVRGSPADADGEKHGWRRARRETDLASHNVIRLVDDANPGLPKPVAPRSDEEADCFLMGQSQHVRDYAPSGRYAAPPASPHRRRCWMGLRVGRTSVGEAPRGLGPAARPPASLSPNSSLVELCGAAALACLTPRQFAGVGDQPG